VLLKEKPPVGQPNVFKESVDEYPEILLHEIPDPIANVAVETLAAFSEGVGGLLVPEKSHFAIVVHA
jgi:hypothetical protein